MAWDQIPDDAVIAQTITALKANGIEAFVVESGQEAKQKVLDLLPEQAEVMTMSSMTLDTIGLTSEINESARYASVKKKLMSMDRQTQGKQIQKLGAVPDWAVGSVHAVTRDGHLLIASNTGSQLPAYVYGAGHVVWVVGAQKIVKDTTEGIQRIYEYCFPLENERLMKAYGVPSGVSKLLIINKEKIPERLTAIFVKEKLGF